MADAFGLVELPLVRLAEHPGGHAGDRPAAGVPLAGELARGRRRPGPVDRGHAARTTSSPAPTGTATSCAGCTGGPPHGTASSWSAARSSAGATARCCCSTPAPGRTAAPGLAHRSSTRRAPSRPSACTWPAAESTGSSSPTPGPPPRPGPFEDSLLDSLAVIKQSSGIGLARGMDLAHGGTGGLFVVVAGRPSADEARGCRGAPDAGPAMALLLAGPPGQAAGRPRTRRGDGRPRRDPARGGLAGHHDHREHPAHRGLGPAARHLQPARRARARAGPRPGRGQPVSQRLTIAAAAATIAASAVPRTRWYRAGSGSGREPGRSPWPRWPRPHPAAGPALGALRRCGLAAQVLYLNLLLSSAHSAGRLIPTRPPCTTCGGWPSSGWTGPPGSRRPPRPTRASCCSPRPASAWWPWPPTCSRCGCTGPPWPGCRCWCCSACLSPPACTRACSGP